MNRTTTTFAVGLIVSMSAATMWMSARPRAAGSPLLADVPAVAAQATVPAERGVKRARYTVIDLEVLPPAVDRPSVREPSITLPLFPDLTVTAVFDRYDSNPLSVTWVGHVDLVSMSSVTLVYGGGLMTGSIVVPNGVYRIRPAPAAIRSANPQPGGELHLIEEVDQAALLPEAKPIEVALPQAGGAPNADTPMGDAADPIDILVLYTPAAAAYAGGGIGIANLINLGVSETNTSYANSGIQQRVRLVHAEQVNYSESGAFSTNLTNLQRGAGALSGVPSMRDAYGADLVMLVVRPTSPDACGIAYLMTSVSTTFAPLGYSVVDASCISPGFTFAHEMGHNMGARHDWYVDSGATPYSYAHGYVDPTSGQRWRTIMAYPDMCTVQGFSCTRLLYWANPDNKYNPYCDRGFDCGLLRYWIFPAASMGVPGGTSIACSPGSLASTGCDADDHRALNNTALTVANLRQRVYALAPR